MISPHAVLRRVPAPLKSAVKARLHPPLLPVGALSPAWRARDHQGQLHAAGGAWQALAFYPGDDTPGCTAQLQDLQAHLGDLEAAGVQVFGVNPADASSHLRFAKSYGFTFPLLVDEGHALSRPFGARMRGLGRTIRTVYLLDPDGRVVLSQRGAPPATALIAAATDARAASQ